MGVLAQKNVSETGYVALGTARLEERGILVDSEGSRKGETNRQIETAPE